MVAEPQRATAANCSRAGETLAAAFADDPVTCWMGRRDGKRDAGRRQMFGFLVANLGLPGNELWTTPDFSAAALWVPPERADLKQPIGQELKMIPAMIAFAGFGGLSRVNDFRKATERHHPKGPPHFYLMTIGVDPKFQGHGIGSALLEANLRYIDTKRLPAYLESSSPKNLALYRRHGFEVISEFRPRADAPPLWGMWRAGRG